MNKEEVEYVQKLRRKIKQLQKQVRDLGGNTYKEGRYRIVDPESPFLYEDPEGIVYYLLDPTSKLIKIGCTYPDRQRKRFQELRRETGSSLRLLATEPGYQITEARRHQQFHVGRVKGEWFQPTDDLIAHIENLESKAQC